MRTAAPWIVLAAILIGSLFQLRAQGRLWICSCSYVLLWSGDIHSADNSQHIADPYTLTHIQHGFVFLGILMLLFPGIPTAWRFTAPVAVEALWEVVENANFIINRYRSGTVAVGYTGDTILNSFSDICACAAGVLIAMRLGLKRTLVLFAVIEVGLILWTRDSLLLNILMLIYPIDAIRVWQSVN